MSACMLNIRQNKDFAVVITRGLLSDLSVSFYLQKLGAEMKPPHISMMTSLR